MNPDAIESSTHRAASTAPGRGGFAGPVLAFSLFAVAGALSVLVGHQFATSAVVDIGPTDARYVHGFHDIERDGSTYFRWTSVPSSYLSLPIRFCGPGSVRLRARRHFLDPAVLTLSIGGRVLGQRSIQARSDHPYEILEFQVPEVTCGTNAIVLLEARVQNGRPLGVAVDWVEIRAVRGFRVAPETVFRGAAVLGMISLAMWLAGGSFSIVLGTNGFLVLLVGYGLAAAPLAAERILSGSAAALALSLVLGLLIAKLSGVLRLSGRTRVALVAITVAAIISRSLFLHSEAFYPDYRVHALVQETLNRTGLAGFLDHLFEIQYARSLGLQQIEGNWYPFPYPPGSYVLAGGVLRIFGLDALDAAMVTAITAAALIPVLTVAVGLAMGLGESACLAGAFFVALQPLLVRRMALGYFPGLAGQFVDAVAVLLMLRVLRNLDSPLRRGGLFTLALLSAFLVYTQSIANFGLLVLGLLILESVRRSPSGVATVRVALAAALALSASVGVFYWRYLPVMDNIANHRPQPESLVLDRLEQVRLGTATDTGVPVADGLDDPYAGSTVDPVRGLGRLGSRLWRFNGPFSIAIMVGGWLLWRGSGRATQNLVVAWAAVPVWISLLAAGLPAPNGFQHLKDLEFAAPLMALALGVLLKRLWDRHPLMSVTLAGAWAIFAARAFAIEFTDRLMTLTGF